MNIHRLISPSKWTTTLLIALQSLPLLKAAESGTAPAKRPNVILCMTDDQGWGDVSYNGLKKIQTPNIDAMAAAGLRFNRFYAQQSCSPTRASVMTGRQPNRLGVFWPGMPLRKQETTIGQLAKQAGYATAHFGKWHLSGATPGSGKVMPASDPLSPQNVGFDETFSVTNYFETNWTFGHNGVPEKTVGDGSDVIVSKALKFIEQKAQENQPFLAVIWFGSPHVPHDPLPEDLKAAGGSGYYGEMIGVDRSIGTLRAGLRKLGVAENTMLWYSSDNGGWIDPKKPEGHGTNADLRGRKGDMWEGGIRVPGLIEWPGRITPGVTEIPAGTVDIFPTLVDLLGVKLNHPLPLDGVSLLPLFAGKMDSRPRPLGFWQFSGESEEEEDHADKAITTNSGPSAWSDNRYKLVKTPPKKTAPSKWELFDLTTDRAEKNDVGAEHPEIVQRMKAELESWQLSVIQSYRGEDYPEKKVIQPTKTPSKQP